MGTLGVQEMVVIFLVALVLFGPKKLPELGRTIGKAITEFRRASSDLKATFEREMQSLERENESLKEITHTAANEIHSETTYEYPYYDAYGSESYEQTATTPSIVSAPEVSGAESQGTVETAANEEQHAVETIPAVEGTVPRTETPQHS